MPEKYGARTLPYASRFVSDADRVLRIPVWENLAGFTISDALNVGLEGGGGARTYWVPKGDYTGAGGTHVTGESPTPPPNNSVDSIRGGPAMRREHLFSVDVRGYDRMFIEWRGKVVSASNFALQAGAPNVARAYFFSEGSGWACGTFTDDPSVDFMREPPVVCYNSSQEGLNSSVMAGATAASADEAIQITSGMPLYCKGFGVQKWDEVDGAAPIRSNTYIAQLQKIAHDANTALPMSTAGMCWGYREKTGGVDVSRYPQANDRLARMMQIGYSTQGGHGQSINNSSVYYGEDLRISGLSRVWFAIWENFPQTLGNALWAGGPVSHLDFDVLNATMTIAGKMHAILVKDH